MFQGAEQRSHPPLVGGWDPCAGHLCTLSGLCPGNIITLGTALRLCSGLLNVQRESRAAALRMHHLGMGPRYVPKELPRSGHGAAAPRCSQPEHLLHCSFLWCQRPRLYWRQPPSPGATSTLKNTKYGFPVLSFVTQSGAQFKSQQCTLT